MYGSAFLYAFANSEARGLSRVRLVDLDYLPISNHKEGWVSLVPLFPARRLLNFNFVEVLTAYFAATYSF